MSWSYPTAEQEAKIARVAFDLLAAEGKTWHPQFVFWRQGRMIALVKTAWPDNEEKVLTFKAVTLMAAALNVDRIITLLDSWIAYPTESEREHPETMVRARDHASRRDCLILTIYTIDGPLTVNMIYTATDHGIEWDEPHEFSNVRSWQHEVIEQAFLPKKDVTEEQRRQAIAFGMASLAMNPVGEVALFGEDIAAEVGLEL